MERRCPERKHRVERTCPPRATLVKQRACCFERFGRSPKGHSWPGRLSTIPMPWSWFEEVDAALKPVGDVTLVPPSHEYPSANGTTYESMTWLTIQERPGGWWAATSGTEHCDSVASSPSGPIVQKLVTYEFDSTDVLDLRSFQSAQRGDELWVGFSGQHGAGHLWKTIRPVSNCPHSVGLRVSIAMGFRASEVVTSSHLPSLRQLAAVTTVSAFALFAACSENTGKGATTERAVSLAPIAPLAVRAKGLEELLRMSAERILRRRRLARRN